VRGQEGGAMGQERGRWLIVAGAVVCAGGARAEAPSFEISGSVQADYVQDFNRVDPAWDDTLRPSRIPTTPGLYGSDGQSIVSVKQSRFGIKGSQDIADKPLEFKFDFDLFGVGDNEGQTTFRLQNFYGSWGPILAGQTDTVFMDGSIFPATIDYWGPTGMIYIRTPQIRFTHKWGKNTFVIAVEKPSNDIDPGNIRILDPAIGSGLQGDEKLPDLTSHYRYEGDWGHVQLAGILRQVGYETVGAPNSQPKGHQTGWGFNLTSNVKLFKKDTLHMGVVYGEGIASYINDGGTDLAPHADTTPTVTPLISGAPIIRLGPEAVPLTGYMFYYDHTWSDQFTSSIGYSQTHVSNTNFQEISAYKTGEYASVNLLYTPAKPIMMGVEYLWGRREDKNGASGDDNRVQFSFKYSFNSTDFFH